MGSENHQLQSRRPHRRHEPEVRGDSDKSSRVRHYRFEKLVQYKTMRTKHQNRIDINHIFENGEKRKNIKYV